MQISDVSRRLDALQKQYDEAQQRAGIARSELASIDGTSRAAALLLDVEHTRRRFSDAIDRWAPLVLANAFQVPKTTMTHTLAGLEKHGLVEMRPNPDDKRSKRVWLTIQRMVPLFKELSQDIPPEKIAALMPVLQEVRASIDALRDRRS